MPPRRVLPLICFVATVLSVAWCHADQDPLTERGFSPEKSFQIGDVDHINLLNGNLILTIPIGGSYPVGGGFAYSLSLSYNSNVWDFKQQFYTGEGLFTQALPCRTCNAGLGFLLAVDQLYPPDSDRNSDSARWLYVGNDGSEHHFYDTLHDGEPTVDGVSYTRDGSYLRMKVTPSGRDIDFPDGTVHSFESAGNDWRITTIADVYGNALYVDYSDPLKWQLADSQGRSHNVNLDTDGTVTSVTFAKFNSSERASYTFNYSTRTIPRSCRDTDPHTSETVSVKTLDTIVLPDGPTLSTCSRWSTEGYNDQGCSDPNNAVGDNRPGTLQGIVLPTGGKIHWDYDVYVHSTCAIDKENHRLRFGGGGTTGVSERTTYDSGGTLQGNWTYNRFLHYSAGEEFNGLQCFVLDGRMTEVTDPPGNATVHYFWSKDGDWDNGLPYTQFDLFSDTTPPSWGGRHLSRQVYSGTPVIACPEDPPMWGGCSITLGTATLLRSTYVGYEHDLLPTSAGKLDTNRRVASERTVFEDDSQHDVIVDSFNFDGLGHYRTTVTAGASALGADQRRITDYNASPWTYKLDASGAYDYTSSDPYPEFTGAESPAHSFPTNGISSSTLWDLNVFDYEQQDQYDSSQSPSLASARQDSCFDAYGYRTRKRVYTSGTSASASDVVTIFTPDAAGNTIREESYGGDTQSINATATLCLWTGATNVYRVDHTYQYGSLQTSRYVDGSGTPASFYIVDNDIDANTGLVASSHAFSTGTKGQLDYTAGIVTDYQYDDMGRLTWEKPVSGQGACTQHAYYPYGASNPAARVESMHRPNASGHPEFTRCETGQLTWASMGFDSFGRPNIESRLMADGTTPQRTTSYNAMGWKTFVSEWASAHGTSYTSYDPFGRPLSVTFPDGKVAATTYLGNREIDRTLTVATSTTSESNAVTKEFYDRNGRLIQVIDPLNTAATYAYDVGGRIAKVTMNSAQTRSFAYDNRGFLTAETLPEVGINGYGTRTYSGYDARGHTTHTYDGAHDLYYAYDRAERLTKVGGPLDGNGQPTGTLLKQLHYATGNATLPDGSTNWANGRPDWVQAITEPPTDPTDGTTTVKETITYGGLGGRVSTRSTDITLSGAPSGNFSTPTFTQAFGWTELGQLASQQYPLCASSTPCILPSRGVTNQYTNGVLTAVSPYYATSVTYDSNGLVKDVAHGRSAPDTLAGVTDHQTVDPNTGMARPSRIYTDGAIWPGTGADADWSAGIYTYDGSGNIRTMGVDSTLKPVGDVFTYDLLSRLATASVHRDTLEGNESYGYDVYGNLTNNAGILLPILGTTNHLNTASYDGAGNQLTWPAAGLTWEYDHLNHMTHMTSSGVNRMMAYTAGGERVLVRERTAGTALVTLRDLGGHVVRDLHFDGTMWSWKQDYVYRDGQLLASVSAPDGLRHYTLDHLGTPRLVTNRCGERLRLFTYMPFGKELMASGETEDPQRLRFTVHERDLGLLDTTNDDVDYMHARNRSLPLGRFVTLDNKLGIPAVPGSWNGFAYVRDNPVRLLDPTGLWEEDFHQYMTNYLAIEAGYTSADAWTIAVADEEVDRKTPAKIVGSEDWILHFPPSERYGESMAGAGAAQRDPKALGRGLHTSQDWWAHAGFQVNAFGHVPADWGNNETDNTAAHPESAMVAVIRTFRLLGGDPSKLNFSLIRSVLHEPNKEKRIELLRMAAERSTELRVRVKVTSGEAGQTKQVQ